ncbi:MAG: metallophosphoesterase [Deinococcales bacterium]
MASAYRFRVVQRSATLAGLTAPLRLTLLADLHFGPFIGAGSVAAWVAASNAARPDLVLLDGDLVDRRAGDVAPLLRELAGLRASLGTYAVWGNHDHVRFGDLSGFAADLRSVGVEVLVNRGVAVRRALYLAGIDDLRRGRPDLAAALAGRPEGAATLLLSHNPDVLPEVPLDVGLTLCGHTHGGQVRLPFVGALVTSSRYGQRFAQGWVEGPARGYVTHGLGVSLLPIRVDCPAELTVLDLLPEGAA